MACLCLNSKHMILLLMSATLLTLTNGVPGDAQNILKEKSVSELNDEQRERIKPRGVAVSQSPPVPGMRREGEDGGRHHIQHDNGFPSHPQSSNSRSRRNAAYCGSRPIAVTKTAKMLGERFLDDVSGQKAKADVVVLVERTKAIGRSYFNFYLRKILSQFLRHYVILGPDNIRLALVSFARDMKVHFNGLNEDILKCDIWEGKKYFDDVLLYPTDDSWKDPDMSQAFFTAKQIFQGSTSRGRLRYTLMIFSGELNTYDPSVNRDYQAEREALEAMNVTLVGVFSGQYWDRYQASASGILDNMDKLIGNECQFLDMLHTRMPITQQAPVLVNFGTDCYCDLLSGYQFCNLSECRNVICSGQQEPTCVRTPFAGNVQLCGKPLFKRNPCTGQRDAFDRVLRYNYSRACICRWSSRFTGPECNEISDPCIPHACANNGTCIAQGTDRQPSTYMCDCPSGYNRDSFCEYKDKNGEKSDGDKDKDTNGTNFPVVGVGAGGGAGGLLIIACAIIIGCCIYRKMKTRRPETAEMATYTSNMELTERPRLDTPVRRPSIVGRTMRRLPLVGRAWPFPGRPVPPPRSSTSTSTSTISSSDPVYMNPNPVTTDDQSIRGPDMEVELISHGLDDWKGYVQDLIQANRPGMKQFCLVDKNRRNYITTNNFLPEKQEIKAALRIFRSNLTGLFIFLNNRSYEVRHNDGMTLVGNGGGYGELYMAKSWLFVVIGYTHWETGDIATLNAVKFLRDYLKDRQL